KSGFSRTGAQRTRRSVSTGSAEKPDLQAIYRTSPGPEISIAPMMDWTDRHCRYFFRLISPNVRLYTEMVTTGALLHGDRDRFLRFNEEEHPIALQLGGSDAKDLAQCA